MMMRYINRKTGEVLENVHFATNLPEEHQDKRYCAINSMGEKVYIRSLTQSFIPAYKVGDTHTDTLGERQTIIALEQISKNTVRVRLEYTDNGKVFERETEMSGRVVGGGE